MNKIFISYSHKDEEWKDRLVTHLKVLEMEGYCSLWDDREIEAGDDWLPGIKKALNEAQIIIMMISADFLISGFIRGTEVPRALERRRKEGVRVIPVVVKPLSFAIYSRRIFLVWHFFYLYFNIYCVKISKKVQIHVIWFRLIWFRV